MPNFATCKGLFTQLCFASHPPALPLLWTHQRRESVSPSRGATHRESPWCARTWRRRPSTRCPPPRRTCTSPSRPPSRCSWSRWTQAARDYRTRSLCLEPDQQRGGRPSGPSCCRTPSSSPGTSTWRSWRTGARSGRALSATGPPGPGARRRWSLCPRRLDVEDRTQPAEVAKGTLCYNTFIVSAELFPDLEPPAPISPKLDYRPLWSRFKGQKYHEPLEVWLNKRCVILLSGASGRLKNKTMRPEKKTIRLLPPPEKKER